MFGGLLIFLFIFVSISLYYYLHFINNFKVIALTSNLNLNENENLIKEVSLLVKNNLLMSFTLLVFLNIVYYILTKSFFLTSINLLLCMVWILFCCCYIYIDKWIKDKLKFYKYLNLSSICANVIVLLIVSIAFFVIFNFIL